MLPELSRRLTAVEDELSRVVELAEKSNGGAPLSDLSERLLHLRAGFDALS